MFLCIYTHSVPLYAIDLVLFIMLQALHYMTILKYNRCVTCIISNEAYNQSLEMWVTQLPYFI